MRATLAAANARAACGRHNFRAAWSAGPNPARDARDCAWREVGRNVGGDTGEAVAADGVFLKRIWRVVPRRHSNVGSAARPFGRTSAEGQLDPASEGLQRGNW
jgi:hypothetical protein